MLLTCLPQSICSWDFCVIGAAAGPASVAFNFWTEQGGITLGDAEYAVRKHGALSGLWTLEQNGSVLAAVQKPSAFFRRFEFQNRTPELIVKAQSPLGRSYDLLSGDQSLGTISPAHPFTRRASIACDNAVSELEQLLAFWLVVITWRRAAKSNHGAHK